MSRSLTSSLPAPGGSRLDGSTPDKERRQQQLDGATASTGGTVDVQLYQAVTGYAPKHDGELTLQPGDIVTAVRQLGNGWALGRNEATSDRRAGIFPSSCVVAVVGGGVPGSPAGTPCAECQRCGGSLRPVRAASPPPPPLPPSSRRARPNNVAWDLQDDFGSRANVAAETPGVHRAGADETALPLGGDGYVLPVCSADASRSTPAGEGPSMSDTRAAAVAMPAHDVTDSPLLNIPQRPAPQAPKPHLVVKPTRDKNLTGTLTSTTPKMPCVGSDGVDGGTATCCREVDAEPGWCGCRPTHHHCQQQHRHQQQQRGPAPAPPARSGLSTFVGRSDPTLRDTVVQTSLLLPQSSSRCRDANFFGGECGSLDGGGGCASTSCAAKHHRHHHHRSFVDFRSSPFGSSPSAPDLAFGGGMRGTTTSGCGILKSRTPRPNNDSADVWRGSSYVVSNRTRPPSMFATVCRLFGCLAVAGLLGAVTFSLMFYDLSYDVYVSLAVAACVVLASLIFLWVSVLCRCVAALALPSLATPRGRVSLCLLAFSVLLAGPVTNVYVNSGEAVRSLTCSAELALNRTASLLRPFDVMMRHLDRTVARLEGAAADVAHGLKPLDEGLDAVEMDVQNARTQLLGTRRTCKNLIDRAFVACDSGIAKAQSQCLGVMGELGNVYHHARDVLDRINPERWAAKASSPTPGLQGNRRRRTMSGFAAGDRGVGLSAEEDEALRRLPPADTSNICEPLSSSLVCRGLNDSDTLCQPARWAGEAIQEAINSTRGAMRLLEGALRFRVRSGPYEAARASANTTSSTRQGYVDFDRRTSFFPVVVLTLRRLVPGVVFLLLLHAAYLYVRSYICDSDAFDNVYVDSMFAQLDRRRAEATGDRLLPLKKHERRFVVDATSVRLSRVERDLWTSGLCVLTLSLACAVASCAFDYAFYWILSAAGDPATGGVFAGGGGVHQAVVRHRRAHSQHPNPDTRNVVAGDGVIVGLLDVFMRGFRPDWVESSGESEEWRTVACLPVPHRPSVAVFVALAVIYVVFAAAVLLKAYFQRFRVSICGFFYVDRRSERVVHLYSILLRRRRRLPCVLRRLALNGRRRRLAAEGAAAGGAAGAAAVGGRCAAFLRRRRAASRCVVCACREPDASKLRDCGCGGLYCAECFVDVGRACPLCRHDELGCSSADSDDDEEDYDDDVGPAVDDGLEAYSSRRVAS